MQGFICTFSLSVYVIVFHEKFFNQCSDVLPDPIVKEQGRISTMSGHTSPTCISNSTAVPSRHMLRFLSFSVTVILGN